MKYTVPDYYREFHCIASDCPATCCAGWQIVIDDRTLKKYRACRTPLGNRLANSIHWKDKTFRQYGQRCAFLNERNLCDIYTEAGPDYLCRTCRNYPRHIEEFENEREISLSLSCPVVAEMVLNRKKKVTFCQVDVPEREEEEEDFDFFLYSALQDCRRAMFDILQDRESIISFRIAKVLALAHDIQNRIDTRKVFEIESLLDRYRRKDADGKLQSRMERISVQKSDAEVREQTEALMGLLDELEVLDPSWPEQLRIYRSVLYERDPADCGQWRSAIQNMWKNPNCDWVQTEAEQLMVYFLFTYLCGAVYDGDLLAKVKMAVASTLLLREMETACQMKQENVISLEDRARIAWRYSRELEHSDLNLNKMEELMNHSQAADFQGLMGLVLHLF
ncbi:MAG: flagellin lysine-N-methylase [Candidatus Choladocola sp.]|nr:flagellin lysine-N-methylase [Candidatus Choladocola sp.]